VKTNEDGNENENSDGYENGNRKTNRNSNDDFDIRIMMKMNRSMHAMKLLVVKP
jgi:hypothetical protein